MNILIMCGRVSGSTMTLARLFLLGRPEGWQVRICNDYTLRPNAEDIREAIKWADVVHWMIHRHYHMIDVPGAKAVHVASVFHLEDSEREGGLPWLKGAPWLCLLDNTTKRTLVEQGWREDRLVCVPVPVDESFFAVGEKRLKHGDRSPRRKRVFRIGFFANADFNSNRKQTHLLPDVLCRLKKRGVNVECVVSGEGWDEMLESEPFRSAPIVRRSAPSYFDMAKLYSDLDVYLCLSLVEGGPMPVFEALACGVPVVSTEVGQVQDVLDPEAHYVALPSEDAEGAAQRLFEVAERHDEYRRQVVSGRKIVMEQATLGKYATSMIRYYASSVVKSDVPDCLWRGKENMRLRRKWRSDGALASCSQAFRRVEILSAVHDACTAFCLSPVDVLARVCAKCRP